MPKVIIVEDETEHARRLESLLQAYSKKYPDFVFNVTHYTSARRFLTEYAFDADIIFLDIQMPDIDGMKAAKRIREHDSHVMLIFTTALAQYAIAGYEVQAFDYILKPLKADVFEAKLSRALRVLNYSHDEAWIDVRTKTETRRISANCITYIEIENHDILIHTDQEVIQHWGSLKEYEQKLAPLHFARCNSCYLVNLKYVSTIKSETVLVAKDELAVSRAKRKEFLVAFAKYKGGSQ